MYGWVLFINKSLEDDLHGQKPYLVQFKMPKNEGIPNNLVLKSTSQLPSALEAKETAENIWLSIFN